MPVISILIVFEFELSALPTISLALITSVSAVI